MSKMEVEDGPTDPADLSEGTSPACSPSVDLVQVQMEMIATPPQSSETAPVMTSSPVIMPRDSTPDPIEENQDSDPQEMEAESDEIMRSFPSEMKRWSCRR